MIKRLKSLAAEIALIGQRIAEKTGWRLLIGLLLSILTIFSFGFLANKIFKGEVSVFDDTVRQAFQQIASPAVTWVMIFFTYLGSVYGIVALLIIAVVVLIKLNLKRSAVILTITMSGEAILGAVLKETFQRPRPQSFFGFIPPDSYSFPSGHAFASLCFFGTLAWIITKQQDTRTRMILIWAASLFFIVIIGSSRVYLGVHYPSDILAGYMAGIIWLLTIYLADHRLQPKTKSE